MNLGRQRFGTDDMSESELSDFLDTVATEPDFGILYGYSENLAEDRIEKTIQMAQERDIEIVTLQTALERINASKEDGGGDSQSSDESQPTDPSTSPDTGTDDGGFQLGERVQTAIGRIEGMITGVLDRLVGLFS